MVELCSLQSICATLPDIGAKSIPARPELTRQEAAEPQGRAHNIRNQCQHERTGHRVTQHILRVEREQRTINRERQALISFHPVMHPTNTPCPVLHSSNHMTPYQSILSTTGRGRTRPRPALSLHVTLQLRSGPYRPHTFTHYTTGMVATKLQESSFLVVSEPLFGRVNQLTQFHIYIKR